MVPRSLLISVALVLMTTVMANPSPLTKAQLAPIAADILNAWDDADLICLGENHGSLADATLRTAVVEHPEFLPTVDVIVLESVSGVHQRLLDRFILDGEELSREELRPAWRDAGRGVLWELAIYEDFLRTVRRVNLTVPRPRRVRLIGGAVPIPWDDIADAKDLLPWVDREDHLRRLIQHRVLDRNLKGLAIFGSFHCEKRGMSFAAALHAESPGRVWSTFAFSGEHGIREGRTRLRLGAEPELVPITGTDHANQPAGAAFFEGHVYNGALLGELLDAAISYGTTADVVLNIDEDALEPTFRREVARRDRLRRDAARLADAAPRQTPTDVDALSSLPCLTGLTLWHMLCHMPTCDRNNEQPQRSSNATNHRQDLS